MRLLLIFYERRKMMETQEQKRRRELTRKTLLRIAELKIEAYKLEDTPEEYLKKCAKN